MLMARPHQRQVKRQYPGYGSRRTNRHRRKGMLFAFLEVSEQGPERLDFFTQKRIPNIPAVTPGRVFFLVHIPPSN